MRDLLSAAVRPVLVALARQGLGLVFDFDGTLAPIVERPAAARMRARTRRLLAEVARRYPCAVLSGRSRRDVSSRLGLPAIPVVGNHGLEWDGEAGRRAGLVERVERWQRAIERDLRQRLPDEAGIMVENKRLSLSVHFRNVRRKREARDVIAAAAAALGPVRRLAGKDVVNLLPAGAADKGTAIRRLCRDLRCGRVLYIGDDVTDEDVFALGDPRVVGVRVGRARSSRAAYFLGSQGDIDRLLRVLLAITPEGAGTRNPRPGLRPRGAPAGRRRG